MNNQAPLDYPEKTPEYQEGCHSRRIGEQRSACPYGMHLMFERHLFLAGWHDTDMGMERRQAA